MTDDKAVLQMLHAGVDVITGNDQHQDIRRYAEELERRRINEGETDPSNLPYLAARRKDMLGGRTPPTISYCTTCMGRWEFLKETLDLNIKQTIMHPNVQFVVLAYGDPATEQKVREHFKQHIASGKLVLASVDAENFHFAHAKNVAHRIATGEVVCNVDADNYLGPGSPFNGNEIRSFTEEVEEQFMRNPNILMRALAEGEKAGVPKERGSGGRIALRRDWFMHFGGYDEANFSHWGGDDRDLMLRGLSHRLELHNFPDYITMGKVLHHSDEERWKHLSEEDQQQTKPIVEGSTKAWITGYFPAQTAEVRNPPRIPRYANENGNFGCAQVRITRYDQKTDSFYDEPKTLEPVTREARPRPALSVGIRRG